MNNRNRLRLLAITGALAASCFTQTTLAHVKNDGASDLQIGIELVHHNYNETIPDRITGDDVFFCKDNGYFGGIAASWAYYGPYMVKLDTHYIAGQIHYESNGTGESDGISDSVLDIRALLGLDFYQDDIRFTPYVGFGYRYLYDNSYDDGKLTTAGASGYDRDSNYLYSPVGMEVLFPINDLWSVAVKAEYDYFWRGYQVSHLEDDGGNETSLINQQNDGWGARGSVQFIRCMENGRRFIVEPFIRYWNIKDSESGASVTIDGEPDLGEEPDNTTVEFGLALKLAL